MLYRLGLRFSNQAINQEKADMHFMHGAAVVNDMEVLTV